MTAAVDSSGARAPQGVVGPHDHDAVPVPRLHLTLLPAETLHGIFQWLKPQHLSPLSRTCRFLRDYVVNNQNLCKDIYLNYFDMPPEQKGLDWEAMLHDIVRLHRLCTRPPSVPSDDALRFVHDALVELLHNASPAAQLFKDEPARLAYLTRSSLFHRARHQPPAADRALAAASAKLHCLYGRTILNAGRTRSARVHPYACAKVYDLRQHTAGTFWGPFVEDGSGRIDWERVEAVMVVLGANMRQARAGGSIWGGWDMPFAGSWPGSWLGGPGRMAPPPPPPLSLPSPSTTKMPRGSSAGLEDPYGVGGTWLRVVCFIDYNDFFAYNFPAEPETALASGEPRAPLEVEEATRLIIVKIRVVGVEPPGEADGQALPVVRFEGTSRAVDDSGDNNADSDIRGTVRLTREGEVRWTSFSVFNGHERWRSESVQVGGVRAAGGVVGHWFDANYDEHGPVGPTAFWKMADPRFDADGQEETTILAEDFIGLVDGFLGDSDSEWDEDYVVGEWGEDDDEEDEDEVEDANEADDAEVEEEVGFLLQPMDIDYATTPGAAEQQQQQGVDDPDESARLNDFQPPNGQNGHAS
ncbi:hypothetical protein HYQ45_010008 [Verticillium longisporum]|uniref:F-box domain-containing protein n=1 Tax=Verticillium longisporum TaxID=100787 RepID=A0A8I2ZKL6_VERLO|nr:hypothetical protein HYQ45_010008 [Verticillium longisporum]